MSLSNKEALALLRLGLEDETHYAENTAKIVAFVDERFREEYRKEFDAETERILHGDGLPEKFPSIVPSVSDRALILLALPPSP